MVLFNRKCNEEQLLLETFFEKLHIERDIGKKQISEFILGDYTTSIKIELQVGGVGVSICCLGHHSRKFSALKLFRAHFVCFFLSFAQSKRSRWIVKSSDPLVTIDTSSPLWQY